MNQSESIAALSAALAKAQGVMEGATKDSSNPFFKSKYADLSSVWDACRKPLSDNGLSVVQTSEFIPEHPDMVCIETLLCHSSGEWIKGRLAVKPVKADPQSVGSCITYLRRYSLQSIVGIAPEDDDGNAASGKHDDKAKPIAQSKKVEPTPTSKEKDDVPIDIPQENIIFATLKDIQVKSGNTKGKDWKLFTVVTDNGDTYGTFDETVADTASSFIKSGELARIEFALTTKGNKQIVELAA